MGVLRALGPKLHNAVHATVTLLAVIFALTPHGVKDVQTGTTWTRQ